MRRSSKVCSVVFVGLVVYSLTVVYYQQKWIRLDSDAAFDARLRLFRIESLAVPSADAAYDESNEVAFGVPAGGDDPNGAVVGHGVERESAAEHEGAEHEAAEAARREGCELLAARHGVAERLGKPCTVHKPPCTMSASNRHAFPRGGAYR